MTDLSQYPPGTILNQMIIDIYANKTRGEITILHDRPFEGPLAELILYPGDRELLFIFEDGTSRTFGVPLKDGIARQMQSVTEVRFFQMDMPSKQPVAEMAVPLRIEAGRP